MAQSEELWREFQNKRDAYIKAQRAFNDAVAALYKNPYPDFDSVTQRRNEQDDAHKAYQAATDAFLSRQ